MKFKYSVIGDNTQENREWLEKVGYKRVHSMYGSFLYTSLTLNEWSFMATSDSHILPNSFIDCRGNSPLFKAVSAIREDSDFGQLFECKDGLFICQYETSREHIDKECKGWNITNLKKFNLEELQERF